MSRKRVKGQRVNKPSLSNMYGPSHLEQWINLYLTKRFIGTYDVCNDECLSEARDILWHIHEFTGLDIFRKEP